MNYTPEQQRDNRQKLIIALESGLYKKDIQCLRSKDGYCCLGVGLELLYPAGWIEDGGTIFAHVLGTDNSSGRRVDDSNRRKFFLEEKVADQYGFSPMAQKTLSNLNDSSKDWSGVIEYLKRLDQRN